MIQVSADIVGNRWDELPPELRDFILSEELSDSIDSLCEENAVEEKRDEIYLLTNLKLYGLVSDEDLKNSLAEIAGPEKSNAVFSLIDGLIPESLQPAIAGFPKTPATSLFKIISAATPRNPVAETSAPSAPAPEVPPQPKPVESVIPDPAEKSVPITPTPAPVMLPAEAPIPAPAVVPAPPIPAPAPTAPSLIIPSFESPTPAGKLSSSEKETVHAAPFMLHQETEVQSVIESAPSSSRLTPLRPSFYTPGVESMREERPAIARLQFGSSQEKPADPVPEKPINPTLNTVHKPVSQENVVNLRDLPL